MATITKDKYEAVKQYFHQLFTSGEQSLNGHKDHPLYAIRKEAIEQLQGLSFPTRRDEDWKYTALTRVFAPEYQEGKLLELSKEEVAPFRFEEEQPYTLVFINGQFSAEHSDIEGLPDKVSLMPVSGAMEDERFSELVKKQLQTWYNDAGRTLVTLNTSFARNGYFLNVPANVVVERPIHFLYLQQQNGHDQMYNPQHLVIAGTSSQVNVIETYHELSEPSKGISYGNVSSRYHVGANAQVGLYKLQQLSKESFQTTNTEAIQEKDSVFSSYVVDLGGRLVRNNLSVWLKGQGTHTDMYGVYLADEDQHIDNQSFMDHAFPHCDSNELYKGILTDKAVGVFNGKVMVRQDAQKTNAFQQNSSLVLSDSAKMDSKPQLEIFADDVKCSHGATIGQLEEELLYYLRTRGLSKEKASTLLQIAFLAEVVEAFKVEGVRAMAQRLIEEKLS